MKFFCKCSVVLFCVMLTLITSLSMADSISPYALGSVQIECRLSHKSGSIIGSVSAMEPAGKTLSLTIAIQYQSSNGTWYTKSSATVHGSLVSSTCAAASGTKYRIRYSYKLFDGTNTQIDAGSGYGNVIQVP